jgi:hypothetical protein
MIAYGTTSSYLTAESGEDALMGLTANDGTNAEWSFGSESTGNDFVWNVSSTQPMNLDASGNLTILGTLTSSGASSFGDLTCDDLLVNSNSTFTGTIDANGVSTMTNITMVPGSPIAAQIFTAASTADFNAAMTATSITTDAGSTFTANGGVDLNAATTATNINMDTGSTLAANILTASGAVDFDALATVTNMTAVSGATWAAQIFSAAGAADFNAAMTATSITTDAGSTFTANGGADFNAAVTCTNLSADSGATVTLANLASLDLNTSAINVNAVTTSGTMAGGLAMSGEATIDGKYAITGGDATTALMVQKAEITATVDVETNSFAVAFGAVPTVICTYTEDPGDVRPIYVQNVTATNFEAVVASGKNFGYIAAGTRP